jgi:hypothetical protein
VAISTSYLGTSCLGRIGRCAFFVCGDARSQRTAKGTPLGRLYADDAIEELGAISLGLTLLGPVRRPKCRPMRVAIRY